MTPTLPPKPTGVPFAAPPATLGNGAPVPETDWNNFSTLAEAQTQIKRCQRAILRIPGAVITTPLQIAEMSSSLGYSLTSPFDFSNPASIGCLVITGGVTVTPPPPVAGEPAPPSFYGQISDLVGNIFAREWVPDLEQYDRNVTPSMTPPYDPPQRLLKTPKKKGKSGWVVTVNGHIWPPSQVRDSKFPTKAQAKALQKEVKKEMGRATVKIRNVEQL